MKRLGKFLFVLIIIGIIIFGIGYLLRGCDKASKEVPSISQAAYKVIADGRYYFTDDYEEGKNYFGQYFILHGYYYMNDSLKWVYKSGDLTLNQRGFKILKVIKRTLNE